MNFQVEILSVVGPVLNRKGKNSWQAIEVAYKKDGKIEGKKIVDFNQRNPEVFKLVGLAKQGEFYNVETEKIDEYWQWTGFTLASKNESGANAGVQGISTPQSQAEGAVKSDVESSVGTNRGTGRVTGSTHETPAERKLKQRYIIRQSSIGYALTLLTHNNQKIADVGGFVSETEVMTLAEKFVEFVYKQPSAGLEGLVQMDNDIPY